MKISTGGDGGRCTRFHLLGMMSKSIQCSRDLRILMRNGIGHIILSGEMSIEREKIIVLLRIDLASRDEDRRIVQFQSMVDLEDVSSRVDRFHPD